MSSTADRPSEIVVKERMSQNIKVSVRCSPPSCNRFRMLGQSRDDRGRNEPSEMRADLVQLMALLAVEREHAGEKDRAGREARRDRIESQP